MRAEWVRVWWGAFCVPGCLTLLRGGLDCTVVWCALGWCKKFFLVHSGEYILTFEFCVIYISVKYLIPFYFGNYRDIKF